MLFILRLLSFIIGGGGRFVICFISVIILTFLYISMLYFLDMLLSILFFEIIISNIIFHAIFVLIAFISIFVEQW
jgi:hypothetical protein